jgi:hypothetical protein
MTATANTPKFTVLQKVEALRQIVTVVKRVQMARPEAKLPVIMRAIKVSILGSLEKLEGKEDKLDAKGLARLHALRTAEVILEDALEVLMDPDTTRELSADEVEALVALREEAKATRKKQADARKAKAKQEEKPKADPRQTSMLKA